MKDKISLKEIKEKIEEIENIFDKEIIDKIEFSKYNDLLFVFTELDKRIEFKKSTNELVQNLYLINNKNLI